MTTECEAGRHDYEAVEAYEVIYCRRCGDVRSLLTDEQRAKLTRR